MACTTLLAGKGATCDGSTMIARNDDSGAGSYTPKRLVTVLPDEQPRLYRSVISHVEIELPDDPMRYTAVPNAVPGEGIWAASGINEENIAMTASETITSNPRVLGADPLVRSQDTDMPGGIGEEDIVSIVLPYIHSAKEGVLRLGALLCRYGTYEMNGIAFQDADNIWWMETIGGHHWIARRVPDDVYVIMPNQFGMDEFDLEDAFGAQESFMCSDDLPEFVRQNHLNPSSDGSFNPRDIFGSRDDSDHVYNTPRAWWTLRYLNPGSAVWDGANADYTPASDNLPWCMVPEKRLNVEDFKYVLSSHYQNTPYDPYATCGDRAMAGAYRHIGVNRTDFMSVLQIRPYVSKDSAALQWICFASNVFNVMIPFYANTDEVPEYLSCTTDRVTADSFYWASRMIAAMADASYSRSIFHIERYQAAVMSKGHEIVTRYDALLAGESDPEKRALIRKKANEEAADMARAETDKVLGKVLDELSGSMKNCYVRSDA